MEENIYLTGIGIQNYKSFGEDTAELFELGKTNILIGKNNTGKSNVLKLLEYISQNPLSAGINKQLEPQDFFQYDSQNIPQLTFKFRATEGSELHNIFGQDEVFVKVRISGQNYEVVSSSITEADITTVRQHLDRLMGQTGGTDDVARESLANNLKIHEKVNFPAVVFIGDYRNLKTDLELNKKLSALINHDWKTQRENKEIKRSLLEFVSAVIGKPTDIKMPPDSEIELVIDSNDSEPLSSLGSGIQQILIMAFHIATNENKIICVDEPELHLHPTIQYKLFELINHSKNQFFIATHSNCFLDSRVIDKRIYHISKPKLETQVKSCSEIADYAKLIDELGIRASELLQTNGIIWVEGPSDRTYINKWLELAGCELVEGLDFTYQYYAGSLLGHYTLDSEFKEFINLFMINKNAVVVMDSDMDKTFNETDLYPRKKKIIEEAKKYGVSYWVTAGREIENYLSNSTLKGFAKKEVKLDQFLDIKDVCKEYKNKVLDSTKICSLMKKEDLNILDLKDKIQHLIDDITRWNQAQ